MPSSPAPLTLAVLGGGNRAQLFFSLAAANPGAYRLVAGADRHAERRARLRALAGGSGFQEFVTAEALLAAPKLADVLIVGTQDAAHFAHALAGLQAGYDLLLEKPIATTPREVLKLARTTRDLGRRG
ncbi:MAG TPA: Gfo/Idh/MocA family oxidoreductase, partial [Lacunisphaera sp.]|nr:Gfo/Idh/MocA family oxidoreductase [Lacunisphaera sp.]